MLTAAPRIGSFCTGYTGLDMAVQQVLGGSLTWVADNDPGAQKILAHHHPDTPNLGDITALNWDDVPAVDIIAAGFPCQDISYAGRGEGIKEGNRSGLWHTIADAVRVLRPRLVVLENVAAIVGRRPGLDVVLADLAALGFDAEWTTVRASDVGAPHRRERWFCLAWPAADTAGDAWRFRDRDGSSAADTAHLGHERGGNARHRRHGPADGRVASADTNGDALVPMLDGEPQGSEADHNHHKPHPAGRVLGWGSYDVAVHRWERTLGRPAPAPTEPGLNNQPRLTPRFVEWMQGLPAGHVTGVPDLTRNQQLKALGNGVVPQQAAHALRILLDRAREEVAA